MALRYGSQSIEDITDHALKCIESDSSSWTKTQEQARADLTDFLRTYGRADVETKLQGDPALIGRVIESVGALFFGVGLQGIGFQLVHHESSDVLGYAHQGYPEYHQIIGFNTGHGKFRNASKSDRRTTFFGTLLHEIDHVVFGLYQSDQTAYSGHHHGWQLVAEALERKASAIFNLELDLARENAFVFECIAMNQISLSEQEIKQCFGDRFSIFEGNKILLNHGKPLCLASDARENRELLNGTARRLSRGENFRVIDVVVLDE